MRLRDVINFLRGLQTILKNNRLRYNEYYDIQNVYDNLYSDSKNGNKFYKLIYKNHLNTMERRMMRKYHVRCEVGEKLEMISKTYLSP